MESHDTPYSRSSYMRSYECYGMHGIPRNPVITILLHIDMTSYGILWNQMGCVGILCYPIVSYGVLWNPSNSCRFLWNLMTSLISYHPKLSHKSYGIPGSHMEPYAICCNHLISYGILYYPMESYGAPIQQYGILWTPMESQSTLHYSLVSYGILWHPM